MRIKLSLKKCGWAGDTVGQNITVYLRQCWSIKDVTEAIHHEVLHAVLNQVRESKVRQDHYIFCLLDIDQF